MFSMSTTVFNFIAVAWFLAGTNSALEETMQCFQLPVTDEHGVETYNFHQTPNVMTVKLTCPKHHYVQLKNDITYMLPKYNSVAGCSRERYADNQLCNNTLKITITNRAGCDNDKSNTCEVQVDSIDINDGCPEYDCHPNNTSPYSLCYARWVAIRYDCVFSNPGKVFNDFLF